MGRCEAKGIKQEAEMVATFGNQSNSIRGNDAHTNNSNNNGSGDSRAQAAEITITMITAAVAPLTTILGLKKPTTPVTVKLPEPCPRT